jgi:hypothetical protein
MSVLIGDYTETAVLLTVNDAHLPYDMLSLRPFASKRYEHGA